ncbi:MAG: sigma-54 dependent transcriptional regulator [Candidatus Omnitrophica bacterium]|nr:sigma-54 dependent transcriptional regulator [Candidatus Omnitrophota bacterium]
MNNKHILIADDEPLTRKSLYEILKFEGYRVSIAADGQSAWEIIEKDLPDILIADLQMPRLDGLGLLRKIKQSSLPTSVLLITAYGSVETAVEAMKEGAFDYITKPIVDNEIKIVIKRIFEQKNLLEENSSLKKQLAKTKRANFHRLIGEDEKMQRIYNLIEVVAPTNATVLIQGESGTGKRLIAQAIHQSDPKRKDKPFIEISCGALPESLLESELFGHVKGSFTSAIRDREGRFEAADGGTLFLDEIDAFTPALQVKLLRVLQEGEFERVGDTKTLTVDVRIVVATNRDLKQCIADGSFREDLFYRLNVIPINLPPLRQRRGDIALLVKDFLSKSSKKIKGKQVNEVSGRVLELMLNYDWPGNVRELENIVERAVIFSKGDCIDEESLPDFFHEISIQPHTEEKNKSLPLKEALKSSEKDIIVSALNDCKGNRKKASETLGINRTTLYNKMKEFDLLDE